jgi:hypothetical protein
MNRTAALCALSLLACSACDAPTVPFEVDVVGLANASGTVVVTRGGETLLTCDDHCTINAPKGAALAISATPADASVRFLGFGAPCGSDATCSLTANAATVVKANFRPSANFAFVTAKTVAMPLGDSAAASQTAADAFCQAQADAVQLPGHYVAWLSTQDRTALSKLAGSSGWVRVDGKPIAATPEKLAQGEIYYPPELDEHGLLVYLDDAATPGKFMSTYYTGTLAGGLASADNCSDYTSKTGAVTVGAPMNGPIWTDFPYGANNKPTCADALSLACFEVGASVDPTPHDSGRIAFVTSETIAMPLANGRADADALCAAEAAAAGLSGEYLALMATSDKSDGAPISRFDTSDGALPWVRVDGVRLVDKARDIGNQALLAPVGVTAKKEYVDEIFWTGSSDPHKAAAAGDDNCADWSDPGLRTISGFSDRDNLWYAQYTGDLCEFPHRVLCLQK